MSHPAAPKLAQIQPALLTELLGIPTLVTAAAKASRDPTTPNRERRVCLIDDGTRRKRIEDLLRECGLAVVVEPIIKWTTRDQSGAGWVTDVEASVSVRLNPTRNAEAGENGGAGVDLMTLVVEVIDAVCRRTKQHGSEYFQHKGGALTGFDEGLVVYDLIFTKEIQQ